MPYNHVSLIGQQAWIASSTSVVDDLHSVAYLSPVDCPHDFLLHQASYWLKEPLIAPDHKTSSADKRCAASAQLLGGAHPFAQTKVQLLAQKGAAYYSQTHLRPADSADWQVNNTGWAGFLDGPMGGHQRRAVWATQRVPTQWLRGK